MPRTTEFIHRVTTSWTARKQQQVPRLKLDHSNGGIISRISNDNLERLYRRVKRNNAIRIPGQQWLPFEHKQQAPRPLYGQFAAAKDNFVTDYLSTACASNILRGFTAPNASVVTLLEKAGMNIVAKTNMDEFGMGSHTTHSAYGMAKNGNRSVGGSSGGSALAVAHNLVDCALGSDTGGSVRLPAAYTNVIGFKPSYGRVTRAGLVPYANSLDTVGLLAQSCETIAKVFNVIDCPDSYDPTCLTSTSRFRIQAALRKRNLRKLYQNNTGGQPRSIVPETDHRYKLELRRCRIGVPAEYNIVELNPIVRQAWMLALRGLEENGHELVPISLPSTQQALSAYYVLALAEASSNLAKYDGVRYGKPRNPDIADDAGGVLYAEHRGAFFGDEVKRRILLGAFSLSAGAMDNYFMQAQKVRRLVQNDFNMVFRLGHPLQPEYEQVKGGVDFIVCPTAPTPPPLISSIEKSDAVESYMNDVFTVPASLAGLPAISIPGHYDYGVPRTPETAVGIQVIGQYGDDVQLINFARRELEVKLDQVVDMSSQGRSRKLR